MEEFLNIQNELLASNITHVGSTDSEIKEVENTMGIKFPEAYIEFLKLFGQDSGELFCGNVVETKNIIAIQNQGRKSYKDALGVECESKVLFVLEHQGYSYYYLKMDEGNNPNLYLLIHGDEITNEKRVKISEFIKTRIKLKMNIKDAI